MRRFAFVIACTVIAACGGGGGPAGLPPASMPSSTPRLTPSPAPSSAAQAMDQIVEQNYGGGWGVELAIFKNGQPLYVHGYGLRDRGLPDSFGGHDFWGVQPPDRLFNLQRGSFAPDEATIFDLASVSKEFTAGAILLLQQDGKLSVNDTLAKYFPSFPSGREIPLLFLLQHRSGLVDYNTFGEYPDFSGAYQTFMASGQTNYQAIVDRLATFPLKFTPGTQYDYSNTNYLLLGMIVAMVSRESLHAFLQQRIFGPLGMMRTNQGFPSPPVSDIALGYADYGLGPQRTYQPNLTWLAGPGGLTSTVDDLDKWDRAVSKPGIFTQASLTQMFSPSPYPQSYGTYADGWFVSTLNGHSYLWHDGDVTGYQTMNAIFPNDALEIVILTNDGSGLDPYYIVPQVFSTALTM